MASAGNHLVVDILIEKEEWVVDYLTLLAGYDVFFVGLHCSIEELERRERARGDRPVGDARRDLDIVHRWTTYDLELDSEEPLEENVAALLQAWRKRQRPSAFAQMRAARHLTDLGDIL